jgi:S1-C subfamily serine protease
MFSPRLKAAAYSLLALALFVVASSTARAEDWRLGVKLFAVSGGGVKIAEVIPNSPADEVGLQPGNVIMTIDGQLITDVEQARDKVFSAGNEIDIVYRDGSDFYQITAQLVTQTYAEFVDGKTVQKKKLVPKGKVMKKKVSDPRK